MGDIMKKIKFIIIFLFCLIFLSNIDAYQLKYIADIDKESSEKENIVFYTVVQASQNSKDEYDEYGSNGQYIRIQHEIGSLYGSYDIAGIILQSESTSTYVDSSYDVAIKWPFKAMEKFGLTEEEYTTYKYTHDRNYNVLYADVFNDYFTEDKLNSYLNGYEYKKYKVIENQNSVKVVKNLINSNAISNFNCSYKVEDGKVIYKYSLTKEALITMLGDDSTEDGWVDWLEDKIYEINGRKYKRCWFSFVTKTAYSNSIEMTTAYQFIENIYGGVLPKIESDETNNINAKIEKLYNLYDDITGKNGYIPESVKPYKEIEANNLKEEIKKDIKNFPKDTWLPGLKGVSALYHKYTRGISVLNDYDNYLYIPLEIFDEDYNKKNVYIDYLELKDGELINLEVAPKEKDPEHQIKYNNSSGYKKLSDLKSDDNYKKEANNYSLNTENEKKYEVYRLIPEEEKIFDAYYMTPTEINNKKKNESKGYIYKYLHNRFYRGNEDDKYTNLSEKIKEQKPNNDNRDVPLQIKTKKPTIVSFIYESTEAKSKVEIEVEHVVEKTNRPLPIAKNGNNVEITKGDGVVIKDEEKTNDILAKYKATGVTVYTQLKFSLLTFSYEDENSGEIFKYNGKYKIQFFGAGDELIASKTFPNRNDGILSGVSAGTTQGVKKIKMTYYYSTTPPGTDDDDDFEVCTKLEYKSEKSTITNECDGSGVGYYPVECTDFEKSVNNTLVIPTDMTFKAQIKAPYYYISDKYGIYQSIEFYYEERKILIDYEKTTIENAGAHGSGTCNDKNGNPVNYSPGFWQTERSFNYYESR